VLVLEDERIVAADLQRLLRELGYDASDCAATASKALTLAEETPPDVVLADIRIEGPVDGIDTAIHLRKHYGAAIIFLTAHADDQTVDRAKQAEPSAYLIKPISPPAVKAAVELALDRRSREADTRALEQALAETSADLLSALNHLPLALQLEDVQQRVVHINPAFRALFNITKEQADRIRGDGQALMQHIQSLCVEHERFGIVTDSLQRAQQPMTGHLISLLDGRKLELEYVPVFHGNKRQGQLWIYRELSTSARERYGKRIRESPRGQ
jgi:CheY-like chemotaxis protein